jgi:hypothetical protein
VAAAAVFGTLALVVAVVAEAVTMITPLVPLGKTVQEAAVELVDTAMVAPGPVAVEPIRVAKAAVNIIQVVAVVLELQVLHQLCSQLAVPACSAIF